jgi:SAM-dependent methyltransferase
MLDSATGSAPLVDELAFGSITAQLVYAAAELGIADRLADGPQTCSALASAAAVQPASLRRLLRALAGLGIVDDCGHDGFSLSDEGRALLAHGSLVRMLCGPEMWGAWGELVPGLRTGERPWERAHGLPVFEYYARHPEAGATFNAAMAEHTRDAAPAIVAAGDFARFRTVMDVGGGDGVLLAEILRAETGVEGVVFDVPEALAGARETLARAGVADRSRVAAGNFFESVPAGADAYVLKQILHDWDDEPATAILRNCRRALAPDGRLLVVERLLPERVGPADRDTLFVDMLMHLVTGGRERTEPEFRALLDAAGLTLTAIGPRLPLGYHVLEARATPAAGPTRRPDARPTARRPGAAPAAAGATSSSGRGWRRPPGRGSRG